MRKLSALLFLAPALALADEVFLAGAGSISGRIVEQTETTVQVDIGDGIVGVPMSSVERIVKGRTPLDEYDERAGRLGPQDVDGWRNLGRWAVKQGLWSQSDRAYERVLALAPDDPEARRALGFVRLDGRWVTEEESYRARGYVKYDGEWMTPDEARMAREDAAADEARKESERREQDAAIAAMEADARAREAEERAREEQDDYATYNPVYWGGWGYGVTYWPSRPVAGHRPANRPAQLPARRSR